MEYRTLGRSSLKVSPLCLGCMTFGNQTDEDESIRITHAAMDAGINFLDNANYYGKGVAEEILGKALAQNGKRDEAVLATKVASPMSARPNDVGSSRYHIMQHCDQSLKRLKTDRIDLYYLHWMDLETPLEESMRALDDLVRQGKVIYTGCSKFAPAWLVEALALCDRHGWVKFIAEQPPYSLVDRTIENELTWTCLRHGVGIIPWGPLGTGILSGKYQKQAEEHPDRRFKKWNERLTPESIERADALKPLAEEKGCTLAEMSLAWVRDQPGVTAPAIGVRTMEHLTSALRSLEVTFTAEELERINKIAPPGSAVSDYYDGNVWEQLRKASRI